MLLFYTSACKFLEVSMNSFSNMILSGPPFFSIVSCFPLERKCHNTTLVCNSSISESVVSASQIIDQEMATCPTENEIELTNTPVPNCNNEQKHQTDHPDFSITQETLAKLLVVGEAIDLEDSIQHDSHGILHEVASALETDLDKGIPGDGSDLYRRHIAFGRNLDLQLDVDNDHKPSLATKGFCTLSLEAFKDPSVILLLCCATLSLVIAIKRNGPEEGIRDGAMLFLAIFIVVNFGSACKLFKARRMMVKHLRRAKNAVLVVRGGNVQNISVSQIVVGDVLCLKSGDQVPVDGLLIYNQDDSILKLDHGLSMNSKMCYSIFSGTTVVEGNCRMLVISVGRNTERSRLMESVSRENEGPGLEVEIERINSRLEQIWLRLSLLILVVQLIRCFGWEAKYCNENHEPDPKGLRNTVEEIMNRTTQLMLKNRQGGGKGTNGLVAMLCILILALRDGLPLGTFILFAYASKKLKSFHQTMVRKLPACATLGLVTTICTSLTGDLTLDHTKMASLWIGLDGTLKEVQLVKVIKHRELLEALREGVCTNSCGLEEDALLWWAKEGLGFDNEEINQSRTILRRETFESDMNLFGLSLRRTGGVGNSVHVHRKGRPDMVLSMCSHYYDATDGTMETLDEQKRAAFHEVIATASSDSFKCFALAYKQIVLEEKEGNTLKLEEEFLHQESFKPIEDALIFVGLVALKNPYPLEVRKAIKGCRERGVKINLVVNDDMQKVRLMANQSGILNQEENMDGVVIEASEFRNSSKEDRKSIVDKIRIMVNCTPSDKLLMVQCLREKGEVVVATGTSIRDSPVLKEADVGLFVGNSEIGKENADMVMEGLDLATISAASELGRCVCNNLVKFLELQLTFIAVAFTLNSIVVLLTSTEMPLSAFQLLWVNLVMDVLGALALSTSMVARSIPSDHQTSHVYGKGTILTKNMWSMWRKFCIQSVYQVTVLLTIYMKGKDILHVDDHVLKAMIFNCYVLCQVFGLINARKMEKVDDIEHEMVSGDKNLFWFIAILGCILILQVAAVEILAVIGHAGKLSLEQWCICIGIGSVSVLIDSTANWIFKAM